MNMRMGPNRAGRRFVSKSLSARLTAIALSTCCQLVSAATFTVDSTADTFDSGNTSCASPCTLRQAMTVANNTVGADTIAFNIAGSGERLITILSVLPAITETLTIDGYTQPGSAPNTDPSNSNATILIRVHGDPGVGALRHGLSVCASNSSIRGLSVTGFGGTQLTAGVVPLGTSCGVPVSNTVFAGNFVGIASDGMTAIGGGTGILAAASNTQIGGTSAADRNVIGGISGNGVFLNNSGNGSTILGNLIGTARDGTTPRGNALGLAMSSGTTNVTIGSVANPNLFAFNSSHAIQTAFNGNNLVWTGNSFRQNGGLAIDLRGNNTPDANDLDDTDTGSNGVQNFPVIGSVTSNGTTLQIQGTLDVGNVSALTYELSVYLNEQCDASGHGEGAQFLGLVPVSFSTSSESFSISVPYTGPLNGRRNITMLARHPSNGSSEFTPCLRLDPSARLIVTTTADTSDGLCNDQCSLRDALLQANAEAGLDEILFAVPGAGPHTFVIGSALPSITQPIILNGYSQSGASPNTSGTVHNAVLKVAFSMATINSVVLNFLNGSEGSEVRGISFLHTGSVFVSVQLSGNSVFAGNWVGVAPDGVTPSSITSVFMMIAGSNARIGGSAAADRNVFANGTGAGILSVVNATTNDTVIENNLFGLLPDGVTAARNSSSVITGSAPTTVTTIRDNVFGCSGKHIDAVGTLVEANTFGLAVDQTSDPIGNCSSGRIVPRSGALFRNNIIVAKGATGKGIEIPNTVSGVVLDRNRFIDNLTHDIDLNLDGPSANDALDVDTGGNNTQNFPVLSVARRTSANTVLLSGSMNAAANTRYRLQFFADTHVQRIINNVSYASSRFLADQDLDLLTDANGSATFNELPLVFANATVVGAVVATATRLDGANNPIETSEQSPAIIAFDPNVATMVVTNTNAQGAGSFAQAFLEADAKPDNGLNPDVITFAIPGTGPFTIQPALTVMTTEGRLRIDGYSQSGAQVNGDSTGSNAVIPVQIRNVSLQIQNSPSAEIRGLSVIANNGQAHPLLRVGPETHVHGNFIGVASDGVTVSSSISNAAGALIDCVNSCGLIGGNTLAERNLIAVPVSGDLSAIQGGTAQGAVIRNNLLGMRRDGVTSLISISSSIATPATTTTRSILSRATAGTDTIVDNVIGGGLVGIRVDSGSVLIQGNSIGGRQLGISLFGFRNGSSGVYLLGGSGHQVHNNVIISNGGDGIDVAPAVTNSAFHSNLLRAQSGLGIDLGSDGVSANDNLDADGGANGLQNFPILTGAVNGPGGLIISGSLSSKSNTHYRIRFCALFAPDPTGHGECDQALAGSLDVLTDAQGNASFSTSGLAFSGNPIAVTATAAELNSGQETTSEFAASVTIRRASDLNLSVAPATSLVVGQSLTATATVNSLVGGAAPTGAVQITTSPNVGSCTIAALSGGVGNCSFAPNQTGSIQIHASYGGDAITMPDTTSTDLTVTPEASVLTIVSDEPDPSTPGSAFTVAFSVSSAFAVPQGTVTISASGGGSCSASLAAGQGFCVLTPLGTGNLTLTADYAGSSVHQASSDTETHSVGAAASTTSIQSISPNPSVFGQAITVVAQTTASIGTPSGPITVSDGAGASCEILSGAGSCELVPVNVGNDISIRADFAGNAGHTSSFGTANHVVQRAEVNLQVAQPFRADSEDNAPVQHAPMRVPVTVLAAAPGAGTPTGTVVVESVLGEELCVIVLPAGFCDLTPLSFGTTDFTASFVGDSHFNERLQPFTATIIPSPLFTDSFECDDVCP